MTSRRNSSKQVSSAGLGAGVVAAPLNANANAPVVTTPGPHKMPRNMKLVSIRHADGVDSLGVVTADGIIDIRATAEKIGLVAPLDLDQLLQECQADALDKVIAEAKQSGVPLLNEANITHGKLFAHPGKIVCVGLNYRQHASEIGMAEPKVPPLFNKFDNALAGQNCVIELPAKEISTKFDYETELLIVIGKHARSVSEADALDYVAGYCTAQDFSSRDLQLELPSAQWMIGKTLDNYAPIGPYFVSADLVGDPNNLKIQTHVNGELRQSSTTADFIFNTQQIIAYISKHFTLAPGDIIFTGTPQGVIAGMPKGQQVWLKRGDKITSTIEKLGELSFSLA